MRAVARVMSLCTRVPVQIHMFLATALGFYERSGLNVTGGINHDNVTAFEVGIAYTA